MSIPNSTLAEINFMAQPLQKCSGKSWSDVPRITRTNFAMLIDTKKYSPDDVLANDMEMLFEAVSGQQSGCFKCVKGFAFVMMVALVVGTYVLAIAIGRRTGRDLLSPVLIAQFGGYFQGYLTFFLISAPLFYKSWVKETNTSVSCFFWAAAGSTKKELVDTRKNANNSDLVEIELQGVGEGAGVVAPS
jgi:hypothetical protein